MIVSAKATLSLAPSLNIARACGFELTAARDDAFPIGSASAHSEAHSFSDVFPFRFSWCSVVFGNLFFNAAGKMLAMPASLRAAASREVACGDCVRVRTATAAVRFVVVQIQNSTESNSARVISVPPSVFASLIASNDNLAAVTYELAGEWGHAGGLLIRHLMCFTDCFVSFSVRLLVWERCHYSPAERRSFGRKLEYSHRERCD